jgi:hypothetical protein
VDAPSKSAAIAPFPPLGPTEINVVTPPERW